MGAFLALSFLAPAFDQSWSSRESGLMLLNVLHVGPWIHIRLVPSIVHIDAFLDSLRYLFRGVEAHVSVVVEEERPAGQIKATHLMLKNGHPLTPVVVEQWMLESKVVHEKGERIYLLSTAMCSSLLRVVRFQEILDSRSPGGGSTGCEICIPENDVCHNLFSFFLIELTLETLLYHTRHFMRSFCIIEILFDHVFDLQE
jgi:hypothetical protein